MGLSSDDPRRPLYAAARWMLVIGAFYLAYGLLIVASAMTTWPPSFGGVIGAGFLAAATMLFVCSSSARKHRRWAVWFGIGLTLVLGVAVALLVAVMVASIGVIDLFRFKGQFGVMLIVAPTFAFALAHAKIIWDLSNSFDGLLREPVMKAGLAYGFEPIPAPEPRPVLPVEDHDVPPTAR